MSACGVRPSARAIRSLVMAMREARRRRSTPPIAHRLKIAPPSSLPYASERRGLGLHTCRVSVIVQLQTVRRAGVKPLGRDLVAVSLGMDVRGRVLGERGRAGPASRRWGKTGAASGAGGAGPTRSFHRHQNAMYYPTASRGAISADGGAHEEARSGRRRRKRSANRRRTEPRRRASWGSRGDATRPGAAAGRHGAGRAAEVRAAIM